MDRRLSCVAGLPLSAFCMLLAGFLCAGPARAGEPVYLGQPWFRAAPDINTFTAPSNVVVAVDNDGRYLLDDLIGRQNPKSSRLGPDSLRKVGGEYYLAMPKDGHAMSLLHTYYRVSQDGKLFGTQELAEKIKTGAPVLAPIEFVLDSDPRYGVPGLLMFPKAGLAVLRGRRTAADEATFGILPMGMDAAPVPFAEKDSVTLVFDPQVARTKRGGEVPTALFADPDETGFWAVGSQGNSIAVLHARPGLKPDGGRSLNLSDAIVVGDAAKETVESGVVSADSLYLLLAQQDDSIGGVSASRRLVRIGLADGKVTDATLSLKHYIPEAALALCGGRIIAYAGREVAAFDRESLALQWNKVAAELTDNSSKDYLIYRVSANADGTALAVALATAYRRAGEPNHVVQLDAAGKAQARWTLKPGPVDDLTATRDGGWLLFSSHYTAKLGGSTPVAENEAASLALAEKNLSASNLARAPAPPAPKVAFVTTPLEQRHKIWFNKPDGAFLPLGNGILGAMVFGGTDTMRIVLDLDSAWAGDENSHGTFQSLGEINFRLGHDPKTVTDYRRELDLRTGLLTVSYRYQDVTYKQEAFCSYPHGLLAIRFTADKPGALTGQLELMSRQKATFTKSKTGIEFFGEKPNTQKVACVMRVDAQGGAVLPEAGKDGERVTTHRTRTFSEDYKSVLVQACDSITLYVAGDTDYAMNPATRFKGADPQEKIAPRLANIGKVSFDQMKQASMADVSRLFDRCTLDLATSTPDAEALPADKRRSAYKTRMWQNESHDVGLQALAFDASRYMMIACSRPGSLPANLQGLWNESNGAAWTGDYHTDINIQMNYWFVEPANLAECAVPLFDYIESQAPYWRKKAKAHFGEKVRGWTVDYMNNIFGAGTYANYPAGSAWLSLHYAEHFQFGQDMSFLEKRAYPVLKELSEHWQDLLIKRPDGALTTPKTQSPEHGPRQYGIGQDRQMVYELLTNFGVAAARLNRDAEFANQIEDLRKRVIAPKIGRWGQIQEWEADQDSRYSRHRHMMHVFAAYPGRAIDPRDHPELSAAVTRTLRARGGGSTGWSKAWRINLFARLQQPDPAYRALSEVLHGFHDNLIWEGRQQIDAPCGFAAGVCELLLQSHRRLDAAANRFEIELLPSLPQAWPTGSVKGLRARGGFEVDIDWQDGALKRATIRNVSSPVLECVIRYQGRSTTLDVPQGESRTYAGSEVSKQN